MVGLTGNESGNVQGIFNSSQNNGSIWTGEDRTFEAYWISISGVLGDFGVKYSCKTSKGDFIIEYN